MTQGEKVIAGLNVKELSLSFGFCTAAFLIPFVWGQPQLLVGSFVNFLLFAGATLLPLELLIPIALAPSMAVFARGLIFGPWTINIAYMLPFIWMGNFVMCWTFRRIGGRGGIEGIGGVMVTAFIKSGFLFLAALVLFNFHLVPKIFLISFGVMQFVTAGLGGGGWMMISNLKFKSQNGK